MKIGYKLTLPAIGLVLLVGCAGTPTVLPPEGRAKVDQTDVRSFIPQSEVNVQYMQSGYGSGLGLIGALVDLGVNAAMAGSAEARAKHIREAVRDFDFRGKYWHAVSNAVAEVPWVKMRSFAMTTNVESFKAARVADGALMNIGTDYFISPDCRVLEVSTGIGVFLPDKPKKIAAANTTIFYSAEIGREEGDKAAALWIADGGAAFRRSAMDGIQENVKLVRYAVELMGGVTNMTSRLAKVTANVVHGRGEFGIPVGRTGLRGYVLEETPTRVVFQSSYGPLYSWPRAEVEIEYLPVK